MISERVPIVVDLPDFEEIEIYPIHDLHYGNEMFNAHKFNELTAHILAEPNRFVCFVGDLMENAVPNSKSDVFSQNATPREQQEFVEATFKQFGDRILAIVDGNHEFNRSTRMVGLYPLYNAACVAHLDDRYRSAYAILDVGLGHGRLSRGVGFITHRAKELKTFGSVDALEGFDFMLCGHDHDPKDHARAHLVYNKVRRTLSIRNVEQVNSGSFLDYGGYGARSGYRPQSSKMYKLVIHAEKDRLVSIETVGFYI